MKKSSHYKNTYILLDAHAIIHRAYHALPDFTTSLGAPTGALYGVISMVLRVLAEFEPDYIIACYDLPGKTFRHVAYEDYKGTRKKGDDALITQLIESRDIFEAFNIPIYDAPGFEADDILGTVALLLKKNKDNRIIIASGDMDTMQLIDDDQVVVYTLKKGLNDTILYTKDDVLARYGFLPEYIPDYKGLRGDPSDNIIGVKGVGEKTATILIQKYGTLEKLYSALENTKTPFSLPGITPRIIDLLKENKDEAFFSKELATIRCDVPITFIPDKPYKEIFDINKAIDICQKYEFKSHISKIKALFQSKKSSVKEDTNTNQLSFDSETIAPSIEEEYLIALSLLNSELLKPNQDDFFAVSPKDTYEDIKKIIDDRIKKEELEYVWKEIEIPLIPIISHMQSTGISIDTDYFKKLSQKFHKELSSLEGQIWKYAGQEFNINSPKQLGDILYTHLQLVPDNKKKTKKTSTGQLSTKESELEKLKDAHPVVSLVLEYREIQKLLSTYIDAIPQLEGIDHRIHTTFHQLGASTGRFSSSNPNMQNIPIKTERGRTIRTGFVAQKGHKLVSFDYSQIELRLAALLSQEPYLIESFNKGDDIHTSVASKVFNVPEKEVTSDMRRKAKTINFGMLYGMGVSALAQGMGVTRTEAQEFWDAYRIELPRLTKYLEEVIARARKDKYTQTLFGRKRFFKNINSPIPMIKAMNERMAINAPIQGTAADVIKKAMIDCDDFLKKNKLQDDCKLVLQVHDEIIFEVADSQVSFVEKSIKTVMEAVIPKEFLGTYKNVPLEVNVSSGINWGVLK